MQARAVFGSMVKKAKPTSLCIAGQWSTSAVQGLSLWSVSYDVTEHAVEKRYKQLFDSLALIHYWKMFASVP